MKPWVRFAGGVLVVAVLYWAQAVLVPLALAVLFAFVLTPPATWLQPWVGRVPAVLLVVSLVFASLGVAGWGLAVQMSHLAEDLPGHGANIRTKIADVRRLRVALPGVRIAVGRWGPAALADDSSQPLLDAGADHVATRLVDSRSHLDGLLEMPRVPVPAAAAALLAPAGR